MPTELPEKLPASLPDPPAPGAPQTPKPPPPAVLRSGIFAARQAGDEALTLTLLQNAMDSLPEASWPGLEMIGIYRGQGDKQRAASVAHAMLQRRPGWAPALVQIGLLERSNGNFEAALAAFEQAHAAEPTSVEAVLHMAQEHFALGRQTRCDALLEQALAMDTGGIQALSHCAQRAMMANDAERALGLYQAAIARSPWQPPPYLGASSALARLGRAAAAMEMLDQAIAQCGSRPGVHARRAQLLRDMGFYREALQVAQAALEAHPNSYPLWEIAMRTLLMIGQDEDIRQWLARAKPMRDGEHAMVAALAGDAQAEFGDPAAAIACYAHAASLQPTNARFPGNMAVASLTRFDVAAASLHLRRQCEMLAPALRLKSRSNNPMQTYFGQIANDYALDTAVVAALGALADTPADRIAPLLALCRAYPDSTLAAASLLDALRRGGALDTLQATTEANAIPRRIVQFWDQATPPDDVLGIMQSWPEQNEGFVHDRFDDLRARAFLAAHHPTAVLVAYHRATAPAMKADLFRLAYLASCGGVYADADDRCTAPISAMLPAGADLVLYREYLGTLGNNFLAAIPAHPVILTALAQAVTAINRGDQDILWLATGPGLITRSFAQVLANADNDRSALLRSTRIMTRREMLRHISIHCAAGYKDTGQHWTKATFGNVQQA